MGVIISDEILHTIHMSETELLQELAVMLYKNEKLTLGQASKLAQINQLQFQHLLGSRGVTINYDIEDFERDLQTLRELKRL